MYCEESTRQRNRYRRSHRQWYVILSYIIIFGMYIRKIKAQQQSTKILSKLIESARFLKRFICKFCGQYQKYKYIYIYNLNKIINLSPFVSLL